VSLTLVEADGVIQLSVDAKTDGEVKEGDSVSIDESRNVAVNGAPRAPLDASAARAAAEPDIAPQP
jgi:hypothetical protein